MIFWFPTLNEEGWLCLQCDTKLGFRPDLDREYLFVKIRDILTTMVEAGLEYVSNGTTGDFICTNVMGECQEKGFYSQEFILLSIMQEPNVDAMGGAKFWKEKAEEWLKENEGS